jgi:hypothetical protein
MITCQNISCRKSFTAALNTLNLQKTPQETYPSCPYCLTRIEIIEEPLKKEEGEETLRQIEQLKSTKVETKNKQSDKPSDCHHHPGYLSERSSKENIPDDCLVCKDIVDCMLKKMRE